MHVISVDSRKGILKVKIEDEEDLWLLNTIVSKGDIVFSLTTREVKPKGTTRSGKGSKRIPMYLGVKVESTEYEPFTNKLRIHGIIIEGPEEFGLKGHYHTFSVSIGSEITIVKEKGIPKFLMEKLLSSRKLRERVGIVALDYDEVALGELRDYGIKTLFTEATRFPGKRDSLRETKFIERLKELSEKIVNTISRENIETLIIASPGFLKEQLAEAIKEYMGKVNVKINIVTAHSSTGGVKGISEVVKTKTIEDIIKNLGIAEKEKLFSELMRRLSLNENTVALGLEEVYEAAKVGAIEYLLVLDETLKNMVANEIEKFEKIMESLEMFRGKVRMYSLHHEAGVQLKQLGGIAALLRFPIRRREGKCS